jgi:hypothetical protein
MMDARLPGGGAGERMAAKARTQLVKKSIPQAAAVKSSACGTSILQCEITFTVSSILTLHVNGITIVIDK